MITSNAIPVRKELLGHEPRSVKYQVRTRDSFARHADFNFLFGDTLQIHHMLANNKGTKDILYRFKCKFYMCIELWASYCDLSHFKASI